MAEPAGDPRYEPPRWVRGELGGATGRGVRVAVIDSGWDRTLAEPRVVSGVSFVDPGDDLALGRSGDDHDRLGHGTACAELILRIAPEARVVPVRVFGSALETSPATLLAGLAWALEAGVRVISVSLGTRLEEMLPPLHAAGERARRAGIIVVAAGDDPGAPSYPAALENVIGVAAARFASPFHFRYRREQALEVEAWGIEQPVRGLGGLRAVCSGTSFAAPNVAGIVALIKERDPAATLDEVRERLARWALPPERRAQPVPREPGASGPADSHDPDPESPCAG